MRDIGYIVIHCTGGPQWQSVEEIKNYWKIKKKWKVPGYHFIILPDGTVVQLLPIETLSNGVAGHNYNSIHVCYIGGVVTDSDDPVNAKGSAIDNRTPEQREAMKTLIIDLNKQFPKAIICGHRDFSPDKNRNGIIEPSEWMKTCPSFSTKDWLVEIGFKTAFATQTFTTISNLNIRTGPGTEFPMAAPTLPKGATITKVAESDEWFYVTAGSVKGWVSSKYLK